MTAPALFNEALTPIARRSGTGATSDHRVGGQTTPRAAPPDYFVQRSPAPSGPGWSMPALHAWLLHVTGYWDNEISHMRKTLDQDIADQSAGAPLP